jgi:hypothetical protein
MDLSFNVIIILAKLKTPYLESIAHSLIVFRGNKA